MTPHPRKEGREPLTREKILDKALEILDAEGAEKLSMRRLGESLGVEAMALYHYFPNKDAILDGVVDRIVQETGPGLPPNADEDWKTVMMSGPASAARALEAHPRAGWLFLGRQYTTAESLQMLEAPLQVLRSAGFEGQALVDAAHAIFAYTAGWYLLTSGQGGTWSGPVEEAIEITTDAPPLTAEFAPQLRDWSHGFEEGLMALMEGLEARLGE
ncbi:MAG: TetR/AcrR family transcriptional regulator C-terminal domain-containing protein [Coriobacteriales bacterium]|nr:TetR/AcrR family transcriptional regulator C-terminal domain-containing protein [Coriobacteriales bacterium]